MSCNSSLICFYYRASFNLLKRGKMKEALSLLRYLYKVETGVENLEEMEEVSELLRISEVSED